jgi:hypothetical protein
MLRGTAQHRHDRDRLLGSLFLGGTKDAVSQLTPRGLSGDGDLLPFELTPEIMLELAPRLRPILILEEGRPDKDPKSASSHVIS